VRFDASKRPVDQDTEKMIIATALNYPETLEDAVGALSDYDFGHPVYQGLFKVIQDLYAEEGQVDLSAFVSRSGLEASKAVGLINEAISGTMMPGLIKKLKEVTRRRAMYDAAYAMASKALDKATDTGEALNEATKYIDQISTDQLPEPERIIDVVERRINDYSAGRRPGTPTGWKDLDKTWAGFCPGELTILAARPSMGKTALAQAMAENIAQDTGAPVFIFSLEMSNDYLVDRYISSQMGINVDWFRRGTVPKETFEKTYPKVLEHYAKLKIYLQDQSNLTTHDIQAQARKTQKKEGLGLIIVDYLTLIADEKDRGESEHLKVQAMTRRLRAIAKNLQVPVLVLAQLSRELEKRTDKRPTLPDLRESGGIEEAADNVLFIYRDSYYNPDTENQNQAEIIVAKQKQGPRGVTALLYYEPGKGIWGDLARKSWLAS